MADAPGPAPTAGAQRRGNDTGVWGTLQRVIIIYAFTQLAMKWFMPSTPATPPVATQEAITYDTNNAPALGPEGKPNPWLLEPATIAPIWPIGSKVAVHVYISQSYGYDLFSKAERSANAGLPSVVWDNLTWGDWNWEKSATYDVQIPKAVQNNGSLFAHLYLTKDGGSPNPQSPSFDPAAVSHTLKVLSRYQPRVKTRKQHNLLSGGKEEVVEEPVVDEVIDIASYWHPNLTLALVSDGGVLAWPSLPPVMRQYINIAPSIRDPSGRQGYYFPVVFPNDFWHMRSEIREINSTTPTLPLTISLHPLSSFKFQLYSGMSQNMDEAAKQKGGPGAAELDELKRMLIETNPYFLALTAIVSVLHMVFEMLAFKNDVQHWRNKKQMVGVSVRTIITNVVVQIIIMLYLVDNTENTSWMILFSQGTGVAIEAWKITKAVDISIGPSQKGAWLPYQLVIKDKHKLSEDEKKTQEYDALAFRYVSYVAIPLLFGYAIYSLIYESHRGWYSYVITTASSFVYMFGFAQLVPQLIINYKLKSVAHMPFKAMIYKSLSTVVDDFFAFCIKMPLMHRLACFRDDVVFVIFLYQRYIYRIDHNRLNEFGQVSEKAADTPEPEKHGAGVKKPPESKKTK